MPDGKKWFGVRCLFWHDGDSYEERITLWWAASFDEAIEQAEEEARAYCEDLNCEYVGLARPLGPRAPATSKTPSRSRRVPRSSLCSG